MLNVKTAMEARDSIDNALAPRRELLRRSLVRLLLEAELGDGEPPGETLAKVHDLCAKELAERVRIAAGELKKAYAGSQVTGPEILLEELKYEVEGYLTGELADLAEDEGRTAALIENIPRFLPRKLLAV